jgi:hypothetical protein
MEMGGRKGKLHPLAWTEYGKVERAWEAHLRWLAIRSTEMLSEDERKQALQKAAEAVSQLGVDAQPLMAWILSSNEGLAAAIECCLEMDDSRGVNTHELSRWIFGLGGIGKEGNVIDQWLIDSGLRSDPTVVEPEPEESSPTESDSNDESTVPSSVGAIA